MNIKITKIIMRYARFIAQGACCIVCLSTTKVLTDSRIIPEFTKIEAHLKLETESRLTELYVSWERQSPDWRFVGRQSGDWRSQVYRNAILAYCALSF
jgi:hypothetical protein